MVLPPLQWLKPNQMRNLAIDMGNSRVKAGLFDNSRLQSVLYDPEPETLPELVAAQAVDQVIVCSVVSNLQDFEKETGLSDVYKLTADLELPISNLYQTPRTLGMDRLAAAAGAHFLYPEENCLVIDAGTTITYDLITNEGAYLGGGISPGLGLRFQSLNQHTRQLPHLRSTNQEVSLIGNSTESSIKSGVVNGTVVEIEGMIRSYDEKFSTLKVIMCGGDATFFESRIKAPIFVNPHLVLIGLNSILMYHARNK